VTLLGICRMWLPAEAWWVAILQSGAMAGIAGGLADWFAVTAIFRGWPGRRRWALPSTNILIRRRRQIEEALLNLLTARVLGKEALREYFQQEPPLGLLLRGLRKPGTGAQRILGHLLLNLARHVPVTEIAGNLAGLFQPDRLPAGMVGQVARLLRYLAREDRLDRLVQWFLIHLRTLCLQPAMRTLVASALHETLTAYRQRGFFKGMAVWFAQKQLLSDLDQTAGEILEAVAREVSNARHDVSGSAGVQVRRRAVRWLVTELESLADDEARLEEYVGRLTAHLADPGTLSPQLEDLLRGLLAQVADESTGVAERAAGQILAWLEESPRGGALEREIGNALPEWIHRADLRAQFRRTLERYGNDELASMTRDYVATDLHWIRVSGTLIGFLVGVGLASLVELVAWLQPG